MKGAAKVFIYKAASYGGDDCLLWPFKPTGFGYGQVLFGGKNIRAHRLVCRLVHGEAPSPQHHVAHSCGTPLCVAPKHLRWATRIENEADKLLHGTQARGETHGASKLTEADVRAIRASYSKGQQTYFTLATQYGVAWTTISSIINRYSWKWVH